MKIGISCYPTFGGSGVIASELGMGLAERGHEVHFITYAMPGRIDTYRPGIYFHEVTVPDYPLFEYPPYSLALASKIAEIAERESLEIIHSHYAIPHAASALLARDMIGRDKLRVVTTLHGTDITLVGRDPSFMPVIKHSIKQSDEVSAVSIFLRDEVCCTFTCKKTVHVIYNFIDPRIYSGHADETLRKRLAPHGEKVLVHVSNFREVKRIPDVMKIFLNVRREIPVKLVLVGSGPELRTAEHMAHAEHACHDFVALGERESITDILKASDVLLLPSESESFGMAALEAMACGVPPVVSNTGGLPEVVEHGVTGYLAPVGDTDAMTGYALELLKDEEKRKLIGETARQRAFDRFNLDAALDAYEGLYERAWGG